MGPRVGVRVTSAGVGSARLTLTGPIVIASGISISIDNAHGSAERLTSKGVTLRPDAAVAGHAVLEVDWFEVGLLRFVKFEVEGTSGVSSDYTVSVSGPITASALQIS
jgi:hypothetical protein